MAGITTPGIRAPFDNDYFKERALKVALGKNKGSSSPEKASCQQLPARLSDALPLLIQNHWANALWETRQAKALISPLSISSDCLAGVVVNINDPVWTQILTDLLKEGKIKITDN